MIIFDNFSRRGNSLPVEEIGCLESIRDLLKQFEIISALAAVVSAVISLLEPPGAVVKCTAGNVLASHDIDKNCGFLMVPGNCANMRIEKTYRD